MPALRAAALVALLLLPCPARAQVVLDETVATVNGDLILKSDLLWDLALDEDVRVGDFWKPEVQALALRSVIDQRLLLQEAAKLPSIQATDEEVAAEIVRLEGKFTGPGDDYRLAQRMALVGLTRARLERIVRRRLQIDKYSDFRFRSFLVVTAQEVVRRLEATTKLPPEQRTPAAMENELAARRAEIERAVADEKYSAAMEAHLEEARARAEIVLLGR